MFMGEIQPVKGEIPLIVGGNSLFKGERSKLRAKPERLERKTEVKGEVPHDLSVMESSRTEKSS